jgi:hypothetical protein
MKRSPPTHSQITAPATLGVSSFEISEEDGLLPQKESLLWLFVYKFFPKTDAFPRWPDPSAIPLRSR